MGARSRRGIVILTKHYLETGQCLGFWCGGSLRYLNQYHLFIEPIQSNLNLGKELSYTFFHELSLACVLWNREEDSATNARRLCFVHDVHIVTCKALFHVDLHMYQQLPTITTSLNSGSRGSSYRNRSEL